LAAGWPLFSASCLFLQPLTLVSLFITVSLPIGRLFHSLLSPLERRSAAVLLHFDLAKRRALPACLTVNTIVHGRV
jgi:hypothetical protein